MYKRQVWKLHRNDNEKAFNVTVERTLTRVKADKLELYELNSDPQEKNKIAIDAQPIAKEMANELAAVVKSGDTGKGTRQRLEKVR